jgi:hypothetical protein
VVTLDFEGVKHFAPGCFNGSAGVLIEQDTENRLTRLLRYENLPPLGQSSLESVVEYATKRREDPRWAAAMEAVVRKRCEEADDSWPADRSAGLLNPAARPASSVRGLLRASRRTSGRQSKITPR